ncbi:ABC transporter substrate-binding protein [Devosia rhizoryzae]|uniref:ABC transporter substrate-binding protein n=1 Tax=Devosia rhizoryzae TaxID=2774137 RepID=A0ABX7C624_9HYPH|nr:ABC transporter substrate-binding protein [Devosia rhizoryzae]QQR38080.1 ABC transporter substrate-binding protein [Devosia rhizoryzae]
MTILKSLGGLAAGVAVVALMAGATLAQDRPTLRIAVQSNPPTAEVIDAESNVGYRSNYSIHDTLIQFNYAGDMSLQPHLATSWEWIDPTTLEVKLREGVIFHDGREMTSEDVVFSFGPERLTGEEAPGKPMVRRYWVSLEGVEAVDKYTVRFTTTYEDPIFLQRLTAWTSQIISKQAYLEAESYDAWRIKPVGAGPFKVDHITPNDETVFVAHDQYWGGKPNAEKVIFTVVPEVSSRVAGLLAGDYDIATDLPPDQLDAVEAGDGVSVVGGPVNNNRIIFFDKTNPVLENPLVRQAISVAIDRQLIVDTIWGGRTQVPNGLQYDFFGDMYLEDFPAYEYNPEKAKQLLAEAGYDGTEISFRSNNNYYTAELATSQALVAMWQAVGLNVVLEVGVDNFTREDGRAFGNWSNSALLPDPLFSLWSQHGPASVQASLGIWSNDEFYALGEKLERSTALEDRRDAFRAMLDINEWTDPGVLTLHQNAVFYGISDEVDWNPYVFLYMDLGPDRLKFN